MTLKNSLRMAMVGLVLGVFLPASARAATITIATYSAVPQTDEFLCLPEGVPCSFIALALEAGATGVLTGFDIEYSGSGGSMGSDSISESLDNSGFNTAIFMNPVPGAALTARILASSLAYSAANGGVLQTTLLDLSLGEQGTGEIRLVERIPTPVPEPALLALVGFGALAVARRGRRQR